MGAPKEDAQHTHGKEGVDGSSPSEGLILGLEFRGSYEAGDLVAGTQVVRESPTDLVVLDPCIYDVVYIFPQAVHWTRMFFPSPVTGMMDPRA
jgi:hypothetical protein